MKDSYHALPIRVESRWGKQQCNIKYEWDKDDEIKSVAKL